MCRYGNQRKTVLKEVKMTAGRLPIKSYVKSKDQTMDAAEPKQAGQILLGGCFVRL